MKSPLSPRQTQILSEISRGLSNKLVANKFGISEQTIKNQLISIMDKLGAENRTHAVVLAMLNGWLDVAISETQIVASNIAEPRKHGRHKIYTF